MVFLNALIVQLMAWTLRLLLVAVGVMVFVVLTTMALFLGLIWAVRALWARLTGQPVNPWGAWMGRVNPRGGFRAAYQTHQRWSQRGSSGGAGAQGAASDPPDMRSATLPGAKEVVDVQARDIPTR